MHNPHASILAELQVLSEITLELDRQRELKKRGKFNHIPSDEINPLCKLAILVEEVGEVAKVLCEYENDRPTTGNSVTPSFAEWNSLHEELTQVAAIAVSWLQGMVMRLDEERRYTL